MSIAELVGLCLLAWLLLAFPLAVVIGKLFAHGHLGDRAHERARRSAAVATERRRRELELRR